MLSMYDADEDDMDHCEWCDDSFYDKDFMDVDDEIFEEAEGDVTLTASEGEDEPSELDHTKGEEDMDVSYFEEWDRTNIEVQHGPETRDDWAQRLLKQLKEEFDKVNVAGKQSQIFADHGQQSRSVVEVDILLELFKNNCQMHLCTGQSRVENWKADGGVLIITWRCCHGGVWSSSKVLCVKKEQNVYTTTIMIAAAIIIITGGGNYEKFALFCKFHGLSFISRSTFMRIQKKYVIPEIKRFWKDMKASIWKIFFGESIILCVDGRNDSPGFSAKYCVYVLMEQFVNVIVDIEVVDKRETGGVSTNMEVYGLKKLLERVVGEIVVSEIVTDASTAVATLVRRMKDKYPNEFGNLFHALDIWHKSVKLTKRLSKAAKIKGCEVLSEWTEPIRNHFWYVAQEKNKTLMDKGSKAMEALRKVVMDPRFLNALHHYVTFRHTSKLENFNSMLLKYTPKRAGFQNDSFIARTLLAAIDHNSHLFRQAALNRDGKKKYNKVYSKRSKNWRVTAVLEEKTYDFWPALTSGILQRKIDDKDNILKK
ncbi:Hypothetical predicted protein [Paramuricea clavata]|uniref:Uncharacterized protein n=1 Tax=Paramuricea clavata TaxID=317549 RepID=A0A6S7J9D5_PARCT|nr:Hypothetical predicted protein [Paramuricea clavata]